MTNYSRGTDYGLGTVNIDRATGIRYGVIHQNELVSAWAEDSEFNYGPPMCPKCGNEVPDSNGMAEVMPEEDEDNDWFDDSCEFHCPACCYSFDSDDMDQEPVSSFVDDGEYQAECGCDGGDIFVTKSPYYTRSQFCSPCAPGAGYLMNPCDIGERTYCFGHEWFYDRDDKRAPYPVYRVSDNTLVEPTD